VHSQNGTARKRITDTEFFPASTEVFPAENTALFRVS
jgi:hypothetical protein